MVFFLYTATKSCQSFFFICSTPILSKTHILAFLISLLSSNNLALSYIEMCTVSLTNWMYKSKNEPILLHIENCKFNKVLARPFLKITHFLPSKHYQNK